MELAEFMAQYKGCLTESGKVAVVRNGQPKAKQTLHDIWQAETRADAEKVFDLFVRTFEGKYLKAVQCLLKDREALLAFMMITLRNTGRAYEPATW